MKIALTSFLLINCLTGLAQNPKYTTGNAHSHNDYEQKRPFYEAYKNEFGSVEADIYLLKGALFVAHDPLELLNKKTLIKYYLEPIDSCIKHNKGFIYSDTTRRLQVLIDIKTAAKTTLAAFIRLLIKYPALINNKSLTWVISGNRPKENLFITYPAFIYFDGDVAKDYSSRALTKIKMMSANFKDYSFWDGTKDLPDTTRYLLQRAIYKIHYLNKPVRFWGAPDNIAAWKQFMDLGVDFINTDKINELARYIQLKGTN